MGCNSSFLIGKVLLLFLYLTDGCNSRLLFFSKCFWKVHPRVLLSKLQHFTPKRVLSAFYIQSNMSTCQHFSKLQLPQAWELSAHKVLCLPSVTWIGIWESRWGDTVQSNPRTGRKSATFMFCSNAAKSCLPFLWIIQDHVLYRGLWRYHLTFWMFSPCPYAPQHRRDLCHSILSKWSDNEQTQLLLPQ